MKSAEISQPTPQSLNMSGNWTAIGLHTVIGQLDSITASIKKTKITADCSGIETLDTAGAWVLNKLLNRLRNESVVVTLQGMNPKFSRLLDVVAGQIDDETNQPQLPIHVYPTVLERVGESVIALFEQSQEFLAFIGETAVSVSGCIAHPARFRWRAILSNIQTSGFNALLIVGLLSFLLGVVVAYQGADQLKQYGANIFVVDLIGLSMLREFAPLITAIIIAGRSGSAYAAQIGTMVVSEEIDAMRTLGISPQEMLVLPKFAALIIALPLLTVFADVLGVFGGMIMASSQLNVGFGEFLDRFVYAVSTTSFLVGIGKAPVFAAIIVIVGCYQGFRTTGGAQSVGQQTTRSVVQSIFLVVVADALFSIGFSTLGI
ncbi:MAG: MlaE family lipid ABC transporter permease subunit [Methylotenera sp.]|nr:MlaE family lipid ABC transporter permease subunit [Methylotenera sp.]